MDFVGQDPRRATGGDGRGTDGRLLFVQLRQRAVRTLLGHRLRKDRDAILERSLCALRRMRRQTFPAPRAEGAPAREIDSRRPSTYHQRSHSLLWWNRRTADRQDTLTSILSLSGRGGREAPGEGRSLYSDF